MRGLILDTRTAASVKAVLIGSLQRTLRRRSIEDPYDPERFRVTSPFHSRLVPDEIWRASKFERSFVTSIGQGVFEQVAVIVARGVGHFAEQGHRETGQVWSGQIEEIASVLKALRSNQARPNWGGEVDRVLRAAGQGRRVEATVISDVYVRKTTGSQHFYSLKTVLPNLDQTEKAKVDSLTLKALSSTHHPNFALPYNPYVTRAEYKWSHPSRIFNMRDDPCVLIGEEFWNDVGGAGTYTILLDIFEEAGNEFRPQIQAYLDGQRMG